MLQPLSAPSQHRGSTAPLALHTHPELLSLALWEQHQFRLQMDSGVLCLHVILSPPPLREGGEKSHGAPRGRHFLLLVKINIFTRCWKPRPAFCTWIPRHAWGSAYKKVSLSTAFCWRFAHRCNLPWLLLLLFCLTAFPSCSCKCNEFVIL